MKKRMAFMLLAVGLVFGGLYGFQQFKSAMIAKAMAALANPRQTVATAEARLEKWNDSLTALGSLRAKDGADLALDASGIVESISFNSGERVEAGTVLLKLQSKDEQAKLNALEATARLNEINYQRDVEQFKIKAVSQAAVDTDAANLKNAKAQVDAQRAALERPFHASRGDRPRPPRNSSPRTTTPGATIAFSLTNTARRKVPSAAA